MIPAAILYPALFGLGAFLSAFAALSIASRRSERRQVASDREGDLRSDTLVFLIRNRSLCDMNFAGARWLESFASQEDRLQKLVTAISSRFDHAETLVGPEQDVRAISRDGLLQVVSEVLPGRVRIKISSRDRETPSAEDVHRLDAIETELETLRANTEQAPFLVWREAADGTPIWVNRAYLDEVAKRCGPDRSLSWPLPRLFPDLKRGAPKRVSLTDERTGDEDWFECHGAPVGRDTLFTAFDANAAVGAERRLREFTQTLTKTFAELPIGLAIFDRSRHLALFNPAFTDLTDLPAGFLTARLSLVDLIDKLHERRMAPEPKDYKSWRQSIAELEATAEDGTYSETWALPGNRTYRVTGQPHPDGAIAFLFEDISAEMALTRQFRADLETSQAIIDSLGAAIVVFAPDGAMIQSNKAYRRLWELSEDDALAGTTIVDATRQWHKRTLPTPVWGELRDFFLGNDGRADWSASATHRDGRALACRFLPLPGGTTLATFEVQSAEGAARDGAVLRAV